jgi:hypothetical protein
MAARIPAPGRRRVGGERGGGGREWSGVRIGFGGGGGGGGISRCVGGGRGFLQKRQGVLVKTTPTSIFSFLA